MIHADEFVLLRVKNKKVKSLIFSNSPRLNHSIETTCGLSIKCRMIVFALISRFILSSKTRFDG